MFVICLLSGPEQLARKFPLDLFPEGVVVPVSSLLLVRRTLQPHSMRVAIVSHRCGVGCIICSTASRRPCVHWSFLAGGGSLATWCWGEQSLLLLLLPVLPAVVC